MKNIFPYFLFTLFLWTSCTREKTVLMPAPTIVILNYDGDNITQEPGGKVAVFTSIQALSGIASITSFVGDSMITTVTPEDALTYDFNTEFTIPPDQPMGSDLQYKIAVEDKDGRTVSKILKITIDQTFLVDEVTIEGTEYTRVYGAINRDYTFSKDKKWLMDSVVSVTDGAVLTIEPGTVVYFRTFNEDNKISILGINQGCRLVAEGSREKPVIFTSDRINTGKAKNGDWGGLIISGKAPVNSGTASIGNGFRYGGADPSDNSGRLRFIRIEYSGKGGFHALELQGVGSGTQAEYIESWNAYNNAFRLRGGRVSLKHIAGIAHGGYGIWADEGWQGNGQFWLFQTGIPATLTPVNYWNQARSIEFRNDASITDKEPRTTFKVSNVTLIGNGNTGNTTDGTRRGLRIREGAIGTLVNAIITGFPDDAVRVEDLPVSDLGNNTVISYMHVFDNKVNWNKDAESFFFESGDYHLSEMPVPGISLTKFDAAASAGFNTSALGSWFSVVDYIGAVNPENDWTSGGQWFRDINGEYR